MRVIFITSDEEVAEWKRQAKAVRMNFSVFIRARLNGTVGDPYVFWNTPLTAEQQAEIEVQMPKVGDTVTIKKPQRFVPQIASNMPDRQPITCMHKKMHGEVCYKCDPKFGYPNLP